MMSGSIRVMRLVLFLLTVAAVAACQSDPPQRDWLTSGMAEIGLEEGRTSQREVLEVFGAPNIVTRGPGGAESWTYERVSDDSSFRRGSRIALGGGYGGTGAGGGAGSGSAGSSSSGVRTVTLIIDFDENERVADYQVMETHF